MCSQIRGRPYAFFAYGSDRLRRLEVLQVDPIQPYAVWILAPELQQPWARHTSEVKANLSGSD